MYSYAEDEMVEDPLLDQHLAHFGIRISQMEKTDKTMAELEIDSNLNFDWSRIQEKDKQLQPIYGPGFTGMQNLGNRYLLYYFTLMKSSCYMASVMQTIFSIPEFQKRYDNNCF